MLAGHPIGRQECSIGLELGQLNGIGTGSVLCFENKTTKYGGGSGAYLACGM